MFPAVASRGTGDAVSASSKTMPISRRLFGWDAAIGNSKLTRRKLLALDTDHFSELERNSQVGQRLAQRLEVSPEDKALTIVTVEEQLRGWLAEISRRRDPQRQITAYTKLQRQIESFAN
jgi:hypothetical protein